jgi:hypothetical protein
MWNYIVLANSMMEDHAVIGVSFGVVIPGGEMRVGFLRGPFDSTLNYNALTFGLHFPSGDVRDVSLSTATSRILSGYSDTDTFQIRVINDVVEYVRVTSGGDASVFFTEEIDETDYPLVFAAAMSAAGQSVTDATWLSIEDVTDYPTSTGSVSDDFNKLCGSHLGEPGLTSPLCFGSSDAGAIASISLDEMKSRCSYHASCAGFEDSGSAYTPVSLIGTIDAGAAGFTTYVKSLETSVADVASDDAVELLGYLDDAVVTPGNFAAVTATLAYSARLIETPTGSIRGVSWVVNSKSPSTTVGFKSQTSSVNPYCTNSDPSISMYHTTGGQRLNIRSAFPLR